MTRSVVLLSTAFAVWAGVHSLLASLKAKAWARRFLGDGADRWYRLVYVTIASFSLVPVLALVIVLPDHRLYVVPAPWRYLMFAGQILALVGLVGAASQAGPAYFLGISQLFGNPEVHDEVLQVRGFYRWVRHPLYAFSIVAMGLTPVASTDYLTLFVLVVAYFGVGSMHEESRLIVEFGEAYDRYRQQVPRLIPRLGRCWRLRAMQRRCWTDKTDSGG